MLVSEWLRMWLPSNAGGCVYFATSTSWLPSYAGDRLAIERAAARSPPDLVGGNARAHVAVGA